MPPKPQQETNPLEPLAEASLVQQRTIGDETNGLLETLVQQGVENNPEHLLSAQLVEGRKNTDRIVGALKPQSDKVTAFFDMMKGEKGDKGDTGDKGDQGDKGDTGDKGDAGQDGIDGVDGIDGTDGKDGKNGLDGLHGADGKNGKDGKDGAKGERGEAGKDVDLIAVKALKKQIDHVAKTAQGRGTMVTYRVNGTLVSNGAVLDLVAGSGVTIAGTDAKDGARVTVSATGGGSGDVSKVGTPVNNQVGVWTGDGTLEGDTALTFDTTTDTLASVNFAGALTGNVTGNVSGSSGSTTGNASTVTTNANLTGHVTSVGNAAVLGSFTTAQLNTALSDNDIATGGGTATGTNTGDNATNSQYSGLVTNATHTGDATGATALTVVKINGTSLAGLATGLLKNTTATGVPSIAVNSDLPVMTATVGGAVPTPPNNTTTFLRGDGTFATPAGSGDMLLASAQTNSGLKTFLNGTLGIRNIANTFTSLFSTAATAARTWTLKDADGTIAFVSDITGTNSGTNTGDQTNISGNAGTVTVADAGGDTTTFVLLGTDATGSLSPRTDAELTYNATTNALTATTFVGALTGTASGNLVSGGALGTPSSGVATNLTGTAAGLTAGNVTTNANFTGHVTSVGNAAVLGSFTTAQLNTAVSDNDVATLAGTEALSNKTYNGNTFTTGTGVLTIAAAKTLTALNSVTLSGTDGVAMNVTNNKLANISFIIDGGGSAITTGIKGDIEIPFACTINQVTMLADQSGSIVVDLWKDTYANYPATIADTITAAAKPTITTATKSQNSTLTGWTTAVAAGDIIRFNVDSITTCTRVLISLRVIKT